MSVVLLRLCAVLGVLLGGVCAAHAETYGPELVVDGDFELNLPTLEGVGVGTGWSSSGLTTSQFYGGSSSGVFVSSGAGFKSYRLGSNTDLNGLQVGHVYEATAAIKTSTGFTSQSQAHINFYGTSGGLIHRNTAYPAGLGGWYLVAARITVLDSYSSCYVNVAMETSGSGWTFYVDDLSVREVIPDPTPTPSLTPTPSSSESPSPTPTPLPDDSPSPSPTPPGDEEPTEDEPATAVLVLGYNYLEAGQLVYAVDGVVNLLLTLGLGAFALFRFLYKGSRL